jgi:soluble lytic murein transglycosylase-like protein
MKARQRIEVDSSDSSFESQTKAVNPTVTSRVAVRRSAIDEITASVTQTAVAPKPPMVKKLSTGVIPQSSQKYNPDRPSNSPVEIYTSHHSAYQNGFSAQPRGVETNEAGRSPGMGRFNKVVSAGTSYKPQLVAPSNGSRSKPSPNDTVVISQFLKIFSIGSGISLVLAVGIGFWMQNHSRQQNSDSGELSSPAPIWSESVEDMLEYQRKTKNLPPLPPIKNRQLVGLAPKGNYVPNKQLPGELVFNEKENAELVMTSQMDDPRLSNEIDLKKGFLRKVTQQVYSVVKKHPAKVDPVELTAMIVSESLKAELDPLLVASVIRTESAFNPKAVSGVGAQGLMQIMPATKTFIENMEAIAPANRKNIFTPRYNIQLGVAYLRYLKDLYNGNISLALMAYNWGPGHMATTLKNRKSAVPHSVLRYALKILDDHSAWYGRISNNILFE